MEKHVFIVTDYRSLNPDLTFNTEQEYLQHWEAVGRYEARLCNKNQLIVMNEFGCEVVLYIPYYFYLFTHHLWFGNKVRVCKGMRPYYYFLPDECVEEVSSISRRFIPYENRPLPFSNKCEHQHRFDIKAWSPPPYKTQFHNSNFDHWITTKPFLVIQNKYNREWGKKNHPPANTIPLPTLISLFQNLSTKYHIVYVRPTPRRLHSNLSYSWDHNTDVPWNEDFDWIEKHNDIQKERKDDGYIFSLEEILKWPCYQHKGYNEVKLELFSICNNYISVQGGGSFLIAYFAEKLLMLHKEGPELGSGVYTPNSWFHNQLNGDRMKILRVATNSEHLLTQSLSMF